MIFVVTGTKNNAEFSKAIEKLRTIGYNQEDELFKSLSKGEPPSDPKHFALHPALQGLLRVWENEFVGLKIEGPLAGIFTLKLNKSLLRNLKYTAGTQFFVYSFVGLKYLASSERNTWFDQCS